MIVGRIKEVAIYQEPSIASADTDSMLVDATNVESRKDVSVLEKSIQAQIKPRFDTRLKRRKWIARILELRVRIYLYFLLTYITMTITRASWYQPDLSTIEQQICLFP